MGKKMEKATVIYGQSKELSPKDVKWVDLEKVIRQNIGPEEEISGLNAGKKAVAEAAVDKKLKDAYVKVGEIGANLVLRIKDKGVLIDTELDTILVKDYANKKQAFAQKATPKTPVTTEPKTTEPKTGSGPEALLEEAQEHLELRQKVIPIMKSLLNEFVEAHENATGLVEGARKQLAAAKQEKAKNNGHGANVAAGVVLQSGDKVREITKTVQDRYKEVMTKQGGDVLKAREDFKNREKLPPEKKDAFKDESNRLFSEGETVSQRIKLLLKQVGTLTAAVDVLSEEAEAYLINSARKPTDFLPRLTTIKEAVTEAVSNIDLKAQKFERLPETLKTHQDNVSLDRDAKLKSLDNNKKLVDTVELEVSELVERVATYKERLKLIPKEAMGYPAVGELMKASLLKFGEFQKHFDRYTLFIRAYREYDQEARLALG